MQSRRYKHTNRNTT